MKQITQPVRKTKCPLCKKETSLKWDSKYESYKGACNRCMISWYDPRLRLTKWMRQVINSTVIVSYQKA
jgi:hypothetical protein